MSFCQRYAQWYFSSMILKLRWWLGLGWGKPEGILLNLYSVSWNLLLLTKCIVKETTYVIHPEDSPLSLSNIYKLKGECIKWDNAMCVKHKAQYFACKCHSTNSSSMRRSLTPSPKHQKTVIAKFLTKKRSTTK